jgi:nucleoside-diphosphate-sugar epimerase
MTLPERVVKTVLLTGASGFVGRQICRALLDDGYEVVATVRRQSARMADLEPGIFRIIETDDLFEETEEWWSEKLAGIDAVVHAAWYVEWRKYVDSDANLDCLKGTLSLIRAAARRGIGHFIGLGTCMEYQLPSSRLTIDSPLQPQNLYSACKLSVYHILLEYFKHEGLAFSWCRIFYLYGEGENPSRLVPYIRRQLEHGETARLSAGTQVRDFLDVKRAGQLISNVVTTGQRGAINICSGMPITIRQLAETIADEYGRRDLLEFGTAPIHPSDPSVVVGVCNAIEP